SQYGSTDELVKKLIAESINHFSNGWGWLVLDGDALKVTSLHDADTPVVYEGMKPILASTYGNIPITSTTAMPARNISKLSSTVSSTGITSSNSTKKPNKLFPE
ncbi:Fe-Mn family superoxide dismutase, partial [Staphylococcus aureus]|uniref:Fe-Mn family superoxide dismutase n=1 Tax=Staphylococcus aureus TaxID=1280 RepID=UPI0027D33944